MQKILQAYNYFEDKVFDKFSIIG
jgi:hypothetical protein